MAGSVWMVPAKRMLTSCHATFANRMSELQPRGVYTNDFCSDKGRRRWWVRPRCLARACKEKRTPDVSSQVLADTPFPQLFSTIDYRRHLIRIWAVSRNEKAPGQASGYDLHMHLFDEDVLLEA